MFDRYANGRFRQHPFFSSIDAVTTSDNLLLCSAVLLLLFLHQVYDDRLINIQDSTRTLNISAHVRHNLVARLHHPFMVSKIC